MEEKVLRGRSGMFYLILFILLYLLAIVALIFGGMTLESGKNWGLAFLIPGVLWVCVGFVPFFGLKVIKPQEALALTLFGKYIGTLKTAGFFFVNPFSSAVNPAAKTKLGQSGDVDGSSKSKTEFVINSTGIQSIEQGSKKISLKVMTLNNSKQKVNDYQGTPVDVGVAVMWRVEIGRASCRERV